MVTWEAIMALINPHLKRVLLAAEAALPGDQYQAYRRLVLAEFGRRGLQGNLRQLLTQRREPGRPKPATKGGVP